MRHVWNRPVWILGGLVLLAGASCNGGGSRNDDDDGDPPSPLSASVQAATGIAIEKGSSNAFQGELVTIGSGGDVTPVLSEARFTYGFVLTSSYVVASGDYYQVTTEDGGLVDCTLIAFRLDEDGPVACLSQARVGNYDPNSADAPGMDRTGIASDGDAAYFTTTSAGTTHLRRWQEGAGEVEILIQLAATEGNVMFQPFVSRANDNVCAHAPGVGSNPGKMICGSVSAGTYAIVDMNSEFVNWDALQVLDRVALLSGTIDLTTLTYTEMVPPEAGPPALIAKTVHSPTGAAVGISGASLGGWVYDSAALVVIGTNGLASLLDPGPWEAIIGNDSYGWVYGGDELRRIELSPTIALQSTNLLASFGLLQISAMSFSTDDRIRIDGTSPMGDPVIVYLDTVTGEAVASAVELPRFYQVTYLE